MPSGQPTRVFLHVGSPKTGTTFLQNVLWSHREVARDQGLLLPLDRFHDHYLATLDVRGLAGRDPYPRTAVGMWDRLVRQALRWSGPVLISHELFAGASEEQARRAVASLKDGAEVHVVVTARDLVRQITAEWQEHVKHRSTDTLAEFVGKVRNDKQRKTWFWRVQDYAGVLERWGADLPAAHLHVVTVPCAGGPAELLWERFAGLIGLAPAEFDTGASRSNTSLGMEQAELLRRVNVALGDRLPIPGPYPAVAKEVLAHKLLARRHGTPIGLTPSDVDFAIDASRATADRLSAMGVDVIGDLEELVPARDAVSSDSSAYEAPSADVLAEEGVVAVADLLVELSHRNAALRRQRERLMRVPVPLRLARASQRHRAVRAARRVYRWVRRGG